VKDKNRVKIRCLDDVKADDKSMMYKIDFLMRRIRLST